MHPSTDEAQVSSTQPPPIFIADDLNIHFFDALKDKSIAQSVNPIIYKLSISQEGQGIAQLRILLI